MAILLSARASVAMIVNLVSSAFFGGPERQMIGLAKALPPEYRPIFFVFGERGRGDDIRGRAMLGATQREGFQTVELVHDVPNLLGMAREVSSRLREVGAEILCCHGYKADVVGLLAARIVGIPCVGVAHGWMAYTPKLAVYMACDWLALRQVEAAVAVCAAQADKLIAGGVRRDRVCTIRNAIATPAAVESLQPVRETLQTLFPRAPSRIVGVAARLSVEKGFDVLVLAAEIVARRYPDAGFVVFGEGPQRARLEKMIAARKLENSFLLPGFRADVESLVPGLDVAVLPSRSEGIPVAILEAMAAGVPVVASKVGGIPEAVIDGDCGYLVAPEDHEGLADRIMALLESDERRSAMGARARVRVATQFTFAVQAEQYARLFDRLRGRADIAPRAEAS
jgi:glycosyltransferase involved in cell wall biosynthesis